MPTYAALTYTADADWSAPRAAGGTGRVRRVRPDRGRDHARRRRPYPTATATTVRVRCGRGGDVVTGDGPYEETKEVLIGFCFLESADLDEAVRYAAQIPASWTGVVDVRPVIPM